MRCAVAVDVIGFLLLPSLLLPPLLPVAFKLFCVGSGGFAGLKYILKGSRLGLEVSISSAAALRCKLTVP